jgi:hypothetical protein
MRVFVDLLLLRWIDICVIRVTRMNFKRG